MSFLLKNKGLYPNVALAALRAMEVRDFGQRLQGLEQSANLMLSCPF